MRRYKNLRENSRWPLRYHGSLATHDPFSSLFSFFCSFFWFPPEHAINGQEFHMHDERMRGLLPQVMESISSFCEPILQTMYALQTDLYQHLYASVHEFATAQSLLDTDTIVDDLTRQYEPIRQHAESEIKSLREGKIARTPVGETGGKPGIFTRKSSSSLSSGGLVGGKSPSPSLPGSWDRKASNSSLLSSSSKTPPLPPPPAPPSYESLRQSSNPSLSTPAVLDSVRRPLNSNFKAPPPPPSAPAPLLSPTPTSRQNSYSGGSRTPSPSSVNGDSVSLSTAAAAKKKPPPPPPPKPKAISPKPEFVVAKYDFDGESAGDLAFRTGDRIKVVKRTDSLEDWWEGELNGVRGPFPRNYCS
jgi:hypothetical protein